MTSLHLLKCTSMLMVVMVPCLLAYQVDSLSDKPLVNSWNYNSPKFPNKEYVRNIHSMIDAFNGDPNGKVVIETNALIDTKYQTLKRNGDFINSLLGLPKGLNDAGR